MIYIVILNTLALIYLITKQLPFKLNFRHSKVSADTEIEEPFLTVPDSVIRFRERMKGVVVDSDGLFDAPPPSVQSDFTGVEIITPSMEVQNDRRF